MKTFTYTTQAALAALLIALSPISYAGGDHGHGHDDHVEESHDDHVEEVSQGPNGGKSFTNGDLSLELAIFEQGIPPEYRAWVSDHGVAVKNAQLTVTLTRLGGQKNVFKFSPKGDYLLGDGVVTEPHSFDVEIELSHNGETHQWEFESHEGRTEIENDIAEKAGISTTIAGPIQIKQTETVYGKTATEHTKISHLKARFPGLVLKVNAEIGDSVKQGQTLATIESNESLLRYTLKAPFDGVITARHANPGELADEQVLFTLADYSQLWVEFQAFPQQAKSMRIGQKVMLASDAQSASSSIQHLIPSPEGKPYLLAGVPIDNKDGQWIPGAMVTGQVVIAEDQVDLAVDNRALQSFRDWSVVFIKIGDQYEIRPLELGRSDGEFTEVLSGLKAGDEYVVENSYLIKADIEKAGASHDH